MSIVCVVCVSGLDHLCAMLPVSQSVDTSVTRLESLCEQEAGITSERKGRHQGMKVELLRPFVRDDIWMQHVPRSHTLTS